MDPLFVFFAAAVECADDAIIGMTLDTKIISWNAGAEKLYGYKAAEIIGHPFERLVPPDHLDEQQRLKQNLLATGKKIAIETVRVTKNGTRVNVSVRVCAVRDNKGELIGLCSIARDITAEKAADQRIQEQAQQLTLALEGGNLGSWNFHIETQTLIDISDTCKTLLGIPLDTFPDDISLVDTIHPDDRKTVQEIVDQSIATRRPYTAEFRIVWPDGDVHWIHAHGTPISTEGNVPDRLICVVQQITERKQREAEQERALRLAEERADRDPLTGLLNHRAFHVRLEEEAARTERDNTTLAVVMLDLDNFKFFNDVFGHATGDQVLHLIADRLRVACRPYDTIARFGGDEFALLLSRVDNATQSELYQRLRTTLNSVMFPSASQETPIPIGVSMGVALFPNDSSDRHEVLHLADERLRLEKSGAAKEAEHHEKRTWALANVVGYSMLDAMVTAVANKDRYTRRHSEDVMTYSLMIARELGMTAGERDTIAVAALLHDVGKIGVPDSILRKPGALSDDEFEAIKQHPQMGAIIVSAVPGLEETLDAIRHHHERWDGNGYPFGLTAEETPLIARLMAVADAFSAMTSDRPYRKGMPHAKAISILQDGAGTQWDTVCVDALKRAMNITPAAD